MADHEEMIRSHKEQYLWTYFANITLGLWLIGSVLSFDPQDDWMLWSDVVSGIVIVTLGTLALHPKLDFWARWGVCFTGIWLLFAPLVFWSPTAFGYANDTLVGALVIAFAVLVPMMPGKAHHMAMMEPGPDLPPGWSYNPSSWWQRGPVIALAIVSFLIARYLAAYQMGHTDSSWDPFFGDGAERVLDSNVSRAWPIPDAGLGALAYMLEALSGFMGNVRRWRTMPWMVLMFGFLVIPLGVTSIVLVILQPVMVGVWCTFCLVTAALMLAMIPLAVDEVVAMFHFLIKARREGQNVFRVFWVGGTLKNADVPDPESGKPEYACPMHPEVTSDKRGRCPKCGMELVRQAQSGAADERSPHFDPLSVKNSPAMAWGVTVPWNLALAAALGLWLMAAPELLGVPIQATAADSDHLVGALVVTTAVIAMAEVVRPLRFLNLVFGLWLLLASWALGGSTTGSVLNDAAVGLILIVISLPRGSVRERYGPWSRAIA